MTPPRKTDATVSCRVALAQINPTVGDLSANGDKIIQTIRRARKLGADLVAFPELAITGYPPEDLLLKPRFIGDTEDTLSRIAPHSRGIAVVLGTPATAPDGRLHNAAAILSAGKIQDIYHKVHLPNYGVFDEARYFIPGTRCPIFEYRGVRFGVTVCEDIWYSGGPVTAQAEGGADLIVNINASPYHIGKIDKRARHLRSLSREHAVAIAYVNQVGGQDELVFDGGSMASQADGRIQLRAPQFLEDLYAVDLDVAAVRARRKRRRVSSGWQKPRALPGSRGTAKRTPLAVCRSRKLPRAQEVYDALVTGTRDYVGKNGFRGVFVALSGGVDSALVASVAADALGPNRVQGVFMPTRYTSGASRADATKLARNLRIRLREIPIDGIFQQYLDLLAPQFRGRAPDLTEENLQARIRGTLIMALSNKFGHLVLTTGNKSEISVGYATLYGDMAGGFGVIKDVPKTLVYELCGWRNRKARRSWIPKNVLTKAPTAELREDQKDTDSLPPYEVLDPVLEAYVEQDHSLDEIIREGCEPRCASHVVRMIDLAEYKRRQAPPGIKITPRAFGRDRRYPITNRYRNYD